VAQATQDPNHLTQTLDLIQTPSDQLKGKNEKETLFSDREFVFKEFK